MSAVSSSIAPSADLVGLVLKDHICDISVYEGSFVYIESGIALNGLADDISTSRVIGVVEFKSSTTTCDIRIGGITEELFSGLDDNNNYFLSPTVVGGITLTAPTTSNNVVVKIGNPISDKIMLLGIQLKVIRA